MDVVWIALGLTLVLLGIIDLFMTVLYYDEAGPLSIRLYRLVWAVLVRVASKVRPKDSSFVLSLGVPIMVLASVLFWIAMQVFGFAFIYFVGLGRGSFRLAEGLSTGFSEALYLSGITLSGLGYGDLAPVTLPFQLTASAQALIGYGFLTLAIAYVVNVYNVIREMGVLSSDIYHESERTYEARHILAVHFHQGQPRGLESRLKNFYYSMIAHHEGMRHYPLVYYFYSRRGYAALPYRFTVIGKVIAAMRWGIPSTHPVAQEPWLLALRSAFESISRDIKERFLSAGDWEENDQPIDAVQFAEDLSYGRSRDPLVQRFIELMDFMEELLEERFTRDPAEVYARYCDWLKFISRVEMFVQASSRHLSPMSGDRED